MNFSFICICFDFSNYIVIMYCFTLALMYHLCMYALCFIYSARVLCGLALYKLMKYHIINSRDKIRNVPQVHNFTKDFHLITTV